MLAVDRPPCVRGSSPWFVVTGEIAPEVGCRLWLVDLDAAGGPQGAWGSLSEVERARAERLSGPRSKLRCVRAHAALRLVLGAVLGCGAREVPLTRGDFGKPCLSSPSDVSFSLAHSGGVAVIATTRAGAIGVDIEAPRRGLDVQRIASRYFAAAEAGALACLDKDVAVDGFLRCWTVKEAVLKGLGVSIWGSLDRVVLDPDPRRPIGLRRLPSNLGGGRWWVSELALARGGARIAVAIDGEGGIRGVHEVNSGTADFRCLA